MEQKNKEIIEGRCGIWEQDDYGFYLQVHPPSFTKSRVTIDEVLLEIKEWGLKNIDQDALEQAVKSPGRKIRISPPQDTKTLLKKTIHIEIPQESYLNLDFMQDGIYAKVCRVGTKLMDFNKAMNFLKSIGFVNIDREGVKECIAKEGFFVKIAPSQPKDILKDGEVLVKLSPDEMEAKITVFPPYGGEPVTPDSIKVAIGLSGIKFGFVDEQIELLSEIGKKNKATLTLIGKKTEPGEDAKLEYLFSVEKKLKPQEKDDGSVDYREIGFVQKIHKGDVLVRKIPATQGKPGFTLTGREVEAPYGKDVSLPQGKGTVISPDGWELIAAIDGSVAIIGDKVCVLPTCEIQKNVDFSTGNIDFPGNVIIKGSVKSGFKVKAEGNIEIYGNVEDAEIEAKGKINIRGGVFGRENAKITAGDDINIKFVENASIFSGGSIKITEGVMHSKVSANKKLIVTGRKGVIVGGKISAGDEINAKIIGSKYATPTECEVGLLPELRAELKKCEKNIEIYKEMLLTTKAAILKLEKMQRDEGGLSIPKKHNLIKLIRLQYNIIDSLNKASSRKIQLEETIETIQNPKIFVQDKIYPGVKIIIKKAVIKITEEYKFITFYEQDGEVKFSSYGKSIKKPKG